MSGQETGTATPKIGSPTVGTEAKTPDNAARTIERCG
jgi:hypothetical protein